MARLTASLLIIEMTIIGQLRRVLNKQSAPKLTFRGPCTVLFTGRAATAIDIEWAASKTTAFVTHYYDGNFDLLFHIEEKIWLAIPFAVHYQETDLVVIGLFRGDFAEATGLFHDIVRTYFQALGETRPVDFRKPKDVEPVEIETDDSEWSRDLCKDAT